MTLAKDTATPPLATGARRWVYLGLGLFFVGLAALGTLLPVLPTTPFLLLAGFFLARSWPALNRWLVRSPLFGPLLRDWQRHRGVRLHVKVTAVTVLLAAVTASALWGGLSGPLLALLAGLAAVGLVVVLRLPLVRDGKPRRAPAEADPRPTPAARPPTADLPDSFPEQA